MRNLGVGVLFILSGCGGGSGRAGDADAGEDAAPPDRAEPRNDADVDVKDDAQDDVKNDADIPDTSNDANPTDDGTKDAGDSAAPTWPADSALTAGFLDDDSIALTWTAATDEIAVVGYRMYQDDVLIPTPLSADSFTLVVDALDFHESYVFRVQAGDAADHWSMDGPQVTTPAIPPNPSDVAPPLDDTVSTPFGESVEFIWSGDDPIQTGVDTTALMLEPERLAVLRGRVLTATGDPLPLVQVSVFAHPELGQTLTRDDGMYDLAVIGGGQVTLEYRHLRYHAAQRATQVPWEDFVWFPDVALVEVDPVVTTVEMDASEVQVARGTAVEDEDGVRQATLLFPAGTEASMTLADGSSATLTSLDVHATEFTVGERGQDAMPAELPPTTAFTYAVEFSVDQANVAGASRVDFTKPVAAYVENFLSLPVGSSVPVGWYDRERALWVPSEDGRVIEILSVEGDMATIDSDGDAEADDDTTLETLGLDAEERTTLATLYAPEQTLWRCRVTHFSPYDYNFPITLPPGATGPQLGPPEVEGGGIGRPCRSPGSVIGCQNQTLEESIPVAGTPFALHYQSGREQGYTARNTIRIPFSSANAPLSILRKIRVEIEIAGRKIVDEPPLWTEDYVYTWDGRDAYGRLVLGGQHFKVTVGYAYEARIPPSFLPVGSYSFGLFGLDVIDDIPGRQVVYYWWRAKWNSRFGTLRPLGGWRAESLALGGWSLSVGHTYDLATGQLYRGDGEDIRNDLLGPVVRNVAGAGGSSPDCGSLSGDATSIHLYGALDLVAAPDGSVYAATQGACVVRVTPDGMLSTVAGTCCIPIGEPTEPAGDGGPATEASLTNALYGIALGSDGSLFLAEAGRHRVRQIAPDGIITTLAGNGTTGNYPEIEEGVPATDTNVCCPRGVAVGSDGAVVVSSWNKIRRIGTDGLIHTVAGQGESNPWDEGVRASQVAFSRLEGLAVGPDGSVYFIDESQVGRITPDGVVHLVAGTGIEGFGGDGGLATDALLNRPSHIEVEADGSILIADQLNHRIRHVGKDGLITTIVGRGLGWTDDTSAGDGRVATAVGLVYPQAATVAPNGDVFVADFGNYRILRTRSASPTLNAGEQYLPSEDGLELYVFDANRRHRQTREILTGATLYDLGYDTSGRLITVTDGYDNATVITRASDGTPTSIIAPLGQTTTLTTDANGYLASVANPLDESVTLEHDDGGLLRAYEDPRGYRHTFNYDSLGRLTEDVDPTGAAITLARVGTADDYTVTRTTPLGLQTDYDVEPLYFGAIRRTRTDPSGAITVSDWFGGRFQRVTQPDGTETYFVAAGDPRWGYLEPLLEYVSATAPSGRYLAATMERSFTASDPDDVFAVETLSDTTTINEAVFTREYDGAAKTITRTSPEGTVVAVTLNDQGEVAAISLDPSLDPIEIAYDEAGRIASLTRGTRMRTFAYDDVERTVTETDAIGRQVVRRYDEADRLISRTLPSGATTTFAYDASGNRTDMVTPSGLTHSFAYSPLDQVTQYDPPDGASYEWSFDADRRRDELLLPSGRGVTWNYHPDGRAAGYTEGATSVSIDYADATGRPTTLTRTQPNAEPQSLELSYDGELLTGISASGASQGAYAFTYDDDSLLRTDATFSSGTDVIDVPIARDQDARIAGEGPFAFTYAGPAGLVSQIADETAVIGFDYTGAAELANQTLTVEGSPVYELSLAYNDAGLVSGRVETIGGGASTTTTYDYDPDGQLVTVTRDGSVAESYTYDVDGNRTTPPSDVAYVFDADGNVAARGAESYTWGARGDLVAATLANASEIRYVYDAFGRRVARISPSGTTEYFYGNPDDATLVTNVRDEDGTLETLLYDHAGRLYALLRGDDRYTVGTDQVGSPRVVADSSGAIVKQVDYDSFGNITADSAPDFFLPIGFGGGLADPATGLVRMAWRDYDPQAGRFMSRDPIFFGGRGPNLYAYAQNDPIGRRDPSGLWTFGASGYYILGIGIKITVTEEGISICFEYGVGVGTSVDIDLWDVTLDREGRTLRGEIKLKFGPANLTLGIASDECQRLSFNAKVKLGPVAYDARENTVASGKPQDYRMTPRTDWGFGTEWKIARRICWVF